MQLAPRKSFDILALYKSDYYYYYYQLRWTSPPDPLTRGSTYEPRWGLPQTPVIGSRSRARHVLAPRTSKPNSAMVFLPETGQCGDVPLYRQSEVVLNDADSW